MDFSVLPDIFSLAVFIAAFRPLVRRVGSHVDMWFLGWGFVLLHYVALFVATPCGAWHTFTQLVALWTLDLCGLVFMLVSANVPKLRIGPLLIAELGAPVLLQAALYTFAVPSRTLHVAVCLLFLVPGIHMLVRRPHRSRPMVGVSIAFAVFALCTAPFAYVHPHLISDGALCLLFCSSAYLYLISAPRYTRGVVAAAVGLAGWGLSFPARSAVMLYYPGLQLERTLVELPQYLVVAGIILTLLEEHVQRTERMAMHDPLTDLPNRRMFEERLIATMDDARLNCTTVACLVIDVDNFKTINDTLGHNAGDQVLRALAVRLSWHMSPRDILARTGGDEFTALLAGVNDEHHLRFIASAMMSAASVPVTIDDQSVDVKISVGIALSPDHADDIDSLRRAADEAMYSAKRRGGSLLAFAGEE